MHPIFVITLGWVWLWTSAISSGTSPQARRHDPNTPEAIPIVVSADGFLKQTLSLPEGSYVFVVLNRTGFRDITVYLERMPGSNTPRAIIHQTVTQELRCRGGSAPVFLM